MISTRDNAPTLLTFMAGAAVGAGIALLLKKDVRGKVWDVTDDTVRKIDKVFREVISGLAPHKADDVPPTFI